MKTIFKSSWLDAISCCGKGLQLKIIRAAIFYQENGHLPQDMTPSVRLALRLILALTDTDPQTEATPDSQTIEAPQPQGAEGNDIAEESEKSEEVISDDITETPADRAAMARAISMLRYPRAGKARKGGKKSTNKTKFR